MKMTFLKLQNFIFGLQSILNTRINLRSGTQEHGYHLVDPSPWPIAGAFGGLTITFGWVLYMHGYSGGVFLWRFGFVMVMYVMFVWWRDVIREATLKDNIHIKFRLDLEVECYYLLFLK